MNCIIVPIYKDFEELSKGELISLTQLYNVLGKHDIYFIGSQNFNWGKFLSNAEKKNIFPQIKEFDKFYFESINGYNQLMMSLKFFKKFKGYQYMLIYQLDAYVFKDELEFWCNKGYDYIGAPWFEGWGKPISDKIIGVGNGGFSLRCNDSCIRIIKRSKRIRYIKKICIKFDNHKVSYFIRFLKIFNFYFKILDFSVLPDILRHDLNEDMFLGYIAGRLFKDFKIAPKEGATKFSFEANPSKLFKDNSNMLPFGCHAWEKHDPEFWHQFIKTEIN